MKHSGLREVEVERWMGMDMDRRGLGTVGRKRRRCEAKKETLTPTQTRQEMIETWTSRG